MTLQYFLRQAWERSVGISIPDAKAPPIDQLRRTEWSTEFESLMRSRLVMGALRYGRLNAPGKPEWDRISNMIERLVYYKKTRNKQVLVDIANLALCEYVEGSGTWKGEYILHTKQKGK